MKTLIISNGKITDLEMLKKFSKEVNLIICADGGVRYALKAGIIPDVFLGDFDSTGNELIDKVKNLNIKRIQFPVNKDKTDTELAIDYALKEGSEEIILAGATGTRLDHTIANIMLLYKLLKIGVKGKIIDDYNEIFITDREMILDKKDETYISIIPLTEDLLGVTLKGFKYETNNIDFNLSTTLGISNVIDDEKGIIKFKKGICLVIRSRD